MFSLQYTSADFQSNWELKHKLFMRSFNDLYESIQEEKQILRKIDELISEAVELRISEERFRESFIDVLDNPSQDVSLILDGWLDRFRRNPQTPQAQQQPVANQKQLNLWGSLSNQLRTGFIKIIQSVADAKEATAKTREGKYLLDYFKRYMSYVLNKMPNPPFDAEKLNKYQPKTYALEKPTDNTYPLAQPANNPIPQQSMASPQQRQFNFN